MIVAKAPLRISFLGGGTDFSSYFGSQGFGQVLGTAIDRFVYVMLDAQPGFEKSRFKFTYRKVEEVEKTSDFRHPVVRSILEELNIETPLNLATMANLPGRSGLGSSSAFTVALYSAIFQHLRKEVRAERVAEMAVNLERIRIGEPGGLQDQYHSAMGGFRSYKFQSNGVTVSKELLNDEKKKLIESGLALIATNSVRDSATYSAKHEERIKNKKSLRELDSMRDICVEATEEIESANTRDTFAILVNAVRESWLIKRDQIGDYSEEVLKIIDKAESVGAEALKLCGAGGAGFVLVLAKPEKIESIVEYFPKSHIVRPKLYEKGVTTFGF